jgi:predicted nucleotidyltransferase
MDRPEKTQSHDTASIHMQLERVEAFCRTNGIRRLALFGSVLAIS